MTIGRVAWFPKAEDLTSNPYWELLQHELEALAITFSSSHHSYWMQRRWLLRQRSRVQVLHFHFIQPQYAGQGERASASRLLKFTSNLILARSLGYRLVWTMHDRMPAWPLEPAWVERFARYVMVWSAHEVIVHCEKGRQLLENDFRRRKRIRVLLHPGFRIGFADAAGRLAARRNLPIPEDCFLIAFAGGIRPNKGLKDLLTAFSRLKRDKIMLLVAGKPWPPADYVEELRKLASHDSRVQFMPSMKKAPIGSSLTRRSRKLRCA